MNTPAKRSVIILAAPYAADLAAWAVVNAVWAPPFAYTVVAAAVAALMIFWYQLAPRAADRASAHDGEMLPCVRAYGKQLMRPGGWRNLRHAASLCGDCASASDGGTVCPLAKAVGAGKHTAADRPGAS